MPGPGAGCPARGPDARSAGRMPAPRPHPVGHHPHMTDEQSARVFDMPHARVTLTPVGPNVEIEVWPKAGQSAYAVVSPGVAILIARQLVELAATLLPADQVMGALTHGLDADQASAISGALVSLEPSKPTAPGSAGPGAAATDTDRAPATDPLPDASGTEDADPPTNIVDLASRRRTGRPPPAGA